jgi:hypothetical protein
VHIGVRNLNVIEDFKIPNKAVQKKSTSWTNSFKIFLEDDMAFANSLRHFPIVKVIPLKAFDAEKERPGEAALKGMVISAIASLKDIKSLWKIDHDSIDLKNKFEQLYYQLDSLKKYCEGDSKSA